MKYFIYTIDDSYFIQGYEPESKIVCDLQRKRWYIIKPHGDPGGSCSDSIIIEKDIFTFEEAYLIQENLRQIKSIMSS